MAQCKYNEMRRKVLESNTAVRRTHVCDPLQLYGGTGVLHWSDFDHSLNLSEAFRVTWTLIQDTLIVSFHQLVKNDYHNLLHLHW